jgi:hypothetical protein
MTMRMSTLLTLTFTLIAFMLPQAFAQGTVCTEEIAREFEARELPNRIPAEIRTCYPMQILPELGDLPACHTMQPDASACAAEPDDVGCPVTIRIQDITQMADGSWSIVYDAETQGAVTDPSGVECEFTASLQGAELQVTTLPEPDPPFIRFSVIDVVLPGIALNPDACDGSAGYATDRITSWIEQLLIDDVTEEEEGMVAPCEPDSDFPDSDGDAVLDCADGCPDDPSKPDPGACGCGIVDDGDADGALFCAGDCDDAEPTVWMSPGEATDLMLTHLEATGETELWWNGPVDPGADTWTYDVISSAMVSSFSAATCVESGDIDTMAISAATPAPGSLLAYLVRAVNGCPDGTGSSGMDSSGGERAVPVCQ